MSKPKRKTCTLCGVTCRTEMWQCPNCGDLYPEHKCKRCDGHGELEGGEPCPAYCEDGAHEDANNPVLWDE